MSATLQFFSPIQPHCMPTLRDCQEHMHTVLQTHTEHTIIRKQMYVRT